MTKRYPFPVGELQKTENIANQELCYDQHHRDAVGYGVYSLQELRPSDFKTLKLSPKATHRGANMRMSIKITLIFIALMLFSGCVSPRKDFLIKKGVRPVTIVIPDNSEHKLAPFLPWRPPKKYAYPVRYAAEFLQRYIRNVTGQKLPIVTEKDAPEENIILIGETAIGKKYGITGEGLEKEGFIIRSFPGGIAITGEIDNAGFYRGTLFGVYHFLEKFAGVRWYFPGDLGTVIPEKESIHIELPVDIKKAPYFKVHFGGLGNNDEWHPVLKFGISEGMVANHTEESWKNLYGKSHPEYFGKNNAGKSSLSAGRHYLCYSEPAVLRQCLENIDNYVKTGNIKPWRACSARPVGKMIPFGPNDTWTKCSCVKCRKTYDQGMPRGGRCSNAVFGFASRLAGEMKKKWPDLMLWCLAYQTYEFPPTDPAISLPDNLGITLCLYPRCSAEMTQPQFFERNEKIIKDWSRLLGNDMNRLIIWNYFCYPNGYLKVPTEHSHVMAKFIQFLKKRSIGIFTNGLPSYAGATYYQTFYMGWLMHQLLWDPDLSVNTLREQYCNDLFSPAKDEMLAFYKLLEDRWENIHWKKPGSYTVPTSTVFNKDYPPDIITKLRKYLDDALKKTVPGSIYHQRISWLIQDVYGPFFDRADAFHQWKKKIAETQVKHMDEKINFDGVLEESSWRNTKPFPLIHQDGTAPWEKSDVYVMCDKQNLYIGAVLNAENLEKIKTKFRKGRRKKALEKGDAFVIQLKTQRKGYLEITIHPTGQFTCKFINQQRKWPSNKVTIITYIYNNVWTIEAAIPWQDLVGSSKIPKSMRAQFLRRYQGSGENYECWSPTLQTEFYPENRFGRLNF